MENVKEIKFVCDVDFLKYGFFSNYLSEDEKQEILNDYAQKTSLIVGAIVNETPQFMVVYNLTPKTLHLQHVVGNFGRYYRELDKFSLALASICQYRAVSFCTKRRAIAEKWAVHAGYNRLPELKCQFEFVKRV